MATATAPQPQMLRSVDPATGRVRAEIPASTPEEVREAVQRARRAAPGWRERSVAERAHAVRELRHRIGERIDDVVETVSAENGKPRAEALSHDVVPSVLTMRYLEAIAPRALRPKPVGRLVGPMFGTSSRIEWRPYGVVGVISPWNYPILETVWAVTPALLAGNTVVVKPSEYTPAVGDLIRELFEALPADVAQVVQGAGDVGGALIDAPCDKICFTGSPATGRKIAEAAARHLTPVVMELGGQDAAIVCEDANLDFASSGVLWGAFLNAGQTCAAIERAYVIDSVADEFERLLVGKLANVRQGPDAIEPDIGPLTIERQLEVVKRHVDDAVEKGAKVLAGGPDADEPRPDGSLWFAPTVLEGRSPEMALFREETFGPVLPIVRVHDEDEAIRRANEDGVNLTASVWTREAERGRRIASRLVSGTITVNDHAVTASAPWGLWGGIGESGYGRLHGELGLREFSVAVHVSVNTMPWMKRIWWYPYDRATVDTLRSIATVLSTPSWPARLDAVRVVARSAAKAIKGKL